MLLYETKIAPNPRRVRIFLAEKGIEVPTKEIDLGKGEHKTPEYRQIAPNSRVPALELDDGTVILETVAICRYFDAQQPAPALFGEGQLGQALVEMWQRRMELELMFPLAFVFRHTHPGMAKLEAQNAEFATQQKKVVNRGLKALDERLQESAFLAGAHYSIADITAQVSLDFFLPLI
ncbi:MAG: glutathione S-transferase family protein, partial [Gammaproteobacteria bacterium]